MQAAERQVCSRSREGGSILSNAQDYRAKAAECAILIANADAGSDVRQLQDSERSFLALAQNEEWLADNFAKIVHVANAERANDSALADDDDQTLRCLGACVILSWETIPAKLQNEILDSAGSMADELRTPELRDRISRALHSRNLKSAIQKRIPS